MKRFQDYWQKRNEKLFLSGEQNAFNMLEDIKTQYEKALKQIDIQIHVFYGKYASENGISMSEARKILTKFELKDFKSDLKEFLDYAKNNNLDKDYIKKLRLLEFKTKISRMDELKAKIEFEIQRMSGRVKDEVTDLLSNTYDEGYYKTIFNHQKFFGFGSDFAALNVKAIQKAILTPYMMENYSDVIWRNKQSLLNILDQQIPQGIILGYNPKKVAELASKKLKTNYNSTVRLVRTEYNLILNDATIAGYKACGVEEYELLATLDDRTSDICQDMDGKHFLLSQKEVGVNYPPFHPNCRTTTIPYYEKDEIDEMYGIGTRLAKDEFGEYYKVPSDITYKKWRETYEI